VKVQIRNDVANVPLPPGQRVDVVLVAKSQATGIEHELGTATGQSVSLLGPGRWRTIHVRVDKRDGLPAGVYDLRARFVPVQPLAEESLANNEIATDRSGNRYQLQVD